MCICSCSILGNPSLEIRRNWRNLTQFHLSRMKSYMHTNNYSRSMQQFVNELMNRKRSQRTDFERCSWRCPAKILLIKTVLASIRPFYQCFYSIFSCQIPANSIEIIEIGNVTIHLPFENTLDTFKRNSCAHKITYM